MSEYKVLVADDDEHVLDILDMYLKKEGYKVVFACTGKEAVAAIGREHPDLVLLDVMMPEMDGFEVCREVRRETRVPIIMLTARDEDIDKILGLELGADDYVTKPFNPREVVARVKAVLRRVADVPKSAKKPVRHPLLEIDPDRYEVKLDGKKVTCTPKEMELLWYLASNPGRVFTREELLEQVWGYDYFGDTRTVDTHIKRLRRKLALEKNYPWEIKTIWGTGYKFELKES